MESGVYWPYFDPEYENFSQRINPPSVSVDNKSYSDCTLIKVDSVNKPGILLEVVQVLSDLDLIITKAYISSDGGWFMDVFHVTDQQGKKISDQKAIEYIETEYFIRHKDGFILNSKDDKEKVIKCIKASILRRVSEGLRLEFCGKDRVGLLSDVTRVLREHGLSVARADVTTVDEQAVNVFYVEDSSGNPVDMKTIEALHLKIGQTVRLNVKNIPHTSNIAKASESNGWAKTGFSIGSLLERFLA